MTPASKAGHLARPSWRDCVDWRYLVAWLGVCAAGLVLAVTPGYPGQDMLSSAVIGAGIAGLLAEVTFWFDRRDTEFDFLVEQRQYTDLELQVGRVDGLAQQTEIIAVNQLYLLGIAAAQCRFLDGPPLDRFRADTQEIGEIVGLGDAVRGFLASRWMRAKDGLAPQGEDPFPAVVNACVVRYSRDGIAALKSGYLVGVAMQTPAGFEASREYRDSVTSQLETVMRSLYLLPQTTKNLTGAVAELESGSCNPRHFIGYLALFSFYLNYRQTGQHAEIKHLFESPLTLTDKSQVREIAQVLANKSGQALEVPDLEVPAIEGAPAASNVQDGEAPTGAATSGEAVLTAGPAVYIRKGYAAFWLIVTVAGLAIGLSSLSFAGKSLICPAVTGAGVAGLLAEVIYCFDRRAAAARVAAKHRDYLELAGHIRRVDELMRRAGIATINQACRLGYAACTIRFGPDDRVQPTIAEAGDLAGILGIAAAFGTFTSDPDLREKTPPGREPVQKLHDALEMRYSKDVIAAFDAGTTFGAVVNNMAGLADSGVQKLVADRLKNVASLLELPDQVGDNLRRISQELVSGACQPRDFGLYLFLFPLYLNYRMTGQFENVGALFESRMSLAIPETAARVFQIVSGLAGKATADTPGGG